MSGSLELHAKYFEFPPPQAVTVCEGKMRTSAQRKTFYAHGLHWLFYGDEAWGNLNYRVSQDGVAWSNAVTLYRTQTWGVADYFSLFFDGVYVDYVGIDLNSRLIYQRGRPNADGTIEWLAPIQQVPDFGPYGSYKYGASDPFICIDSTGCPWIGTYETHGDYWTPIVVKNRRNDGIWETDNSFPFYLDTSKHDFCALPLSLTNGKVYALMFKVWGTADYPPNLVYGRLWNGSNWEALEQATRSKVNNPDFHTLSVVEDGDDIHLVFPRLDTYELAYVKRTSQGWSPEQVIKQTTQVTSPVMCFDERSNELVVFWFENGTLYRAKTINKSWNYVIPETLLTEASNPRLAGDFLCSRRENYLVGITWAMPKADPYAINTILRYCYSGLF